MPPIQRTNPRQQMIKEIRLMLGEGRVRVELNPEHYELALDIALERYRYRSSNSVEERFTFLTLQPDQVEYYLPQEVMEVRQILRRGTAGNASGIGSQIDPFSTAYTNQYMLQANQGGQGLLTYELFADFQEMVGRMFGQHVTYQFDPNTSALRIDRKISSPEQVLMWIYTYVPEDVLVKDFKARTWIRDYALARSKMFLGEIRGKFSSIAGPAGGTSLNGDALKAEAQTEMERLENEVSTQMDQDMGYGFLIG